MTAGVLSSSYKKVLEDILSELARLRELRKDSFEYSEGCTEIASKLEAALADLSDGEFVFNDTEKKMLAEIYSLLTAEETYANAAADLRNISDFSRLLNNG